MTAFTLHPCHLFPPSILAPLLLCTPPYSSTSPRRADLLVFFPFRPLLWFIRFAQRHGYSCCSSRYFSFFSCCVFPFLLFARCSSASVFVPPATFGISLPRDAFLLLLPLLLACPSFSSSKLVQLFLLFSLSERDANNDDRCAREG